jgi:hypothetical protein
MRRSLEKGSRAEPGGADADSARGAVAARHLVVCCVLAAVAALAAAASVRGAADEFMRVELPPTREVRVENRFGGVKVELWGEPHVGVAAGVEGSTEADGKSPVRLERTANSLAVVVAAPARRADSGRRVHLRLRVPPDARLSVFTADGAVELAGNPAWLDAQTVSGDLRARLAGDTDVMARALSGTITVRAGLVAPGGAGRTVRERFSARLGAGSRLVRLSTTRGHIELSRLGGDETAAAQAPSMTSDAGSEGDSGARRESGNARRGQTPSAPPSMTADTERAAAPQQRPALQPATPQQTEPPAARARSACRRRSGSA